MRYSAWDTKAEAAKGASTAVSEETRIFGIEVQPLSGMLSKALLSVTQQSTCQSGFCQSSGRSTAPSSAAEPPDVESMQRGQCDCRAWGRHRMVLICMILAATGSDRRGSRLRGRTVYRPSCPVASIFDCALVHFSGLTVNCVGRWEDRVLVCM